MGLIPVGNDGLTLDQAVELMNSNPVSTLVAEDGDEVVGVAIGVVVAGVGWIYRLTVASNIDASELTQQLLGELELKLAEAGARKVATVLEEGAASLPEFARYGYGALQTMRYLERPLRAMRVAAPAALGV